MVSKIDMRTTIYPGEPCPFVGNPRVRCRICHDENPFDNTQYICECASDEPVAQTMVV